jgi:hypothetical protein
LPRRKAEVVAIAGVAMLLFIGACLTVGVRILLLFLTTRGKAELYYGLGFTLSGCFGYPLTMISGVGRTAVGEANIPLHLVSVACT